jgi:hypothetical protein
VIFPSKKHKNARFCFTQSLVNSGYFLIVFNILLPFCSSIPIFVVGKKNGTKTYALVLQTRSLPCFTGLRTHWYPLGKKIIPDDIYDLLTPAALAHLMQLVFLEHYQ